MLLSGNTNKDGRSFLKTRVLASAVPVGGRRRRRRRRADGLARRDLGQPGEQVRRVQGRAATAPRCSQAHPDLPGDIVAWYEATLLGPARAPPSPPRSGRGPSRAHGPHAGLDGRAGRSRLASPRRWRRSERRTRRPPSSTAGFVNQLGYEALELGDTRSAVAIMQLNVEAQPFLVQRLGQPGRRLPRRRPAGEGASGGREDPGAPARRTRRRTTSCRSSSARARSRSSTS